MVIDNPSLILISKTSIDVQELQPNSVTSGGGPKRCAQEGGIRHVTVPEKLKTKRDIDGHQWVFFFLFFYNVPLCHWQHETIMADAISPRDANFQNLSFSLPGNIRHCHLSLCECQCKIIISDQYDSRSPIAIPIAAHSFLHINLSSLTHSTQ